MILFNYIMKADFTAELYIIKDLRDMKNSIKKKLIEVLDTLNQGVEFGLKSNEPEHLQMLVDCFSSVTNIQQVILKNIDHHKVNNYNDIIVNIKTQLAIAYNSKENKQEYKGDLTVYIQILLDKLKSEPVKYEIVFMPYKSSMWDSMESIWRAAQNDESCECFVMPIPYYDRNPDRTLGQMHYEGNQIPDYVKITKPDEYNIMARTPDIVYIHNPYDEYNYVTSVHPDFYSYKIKPYTNMLVYVPYCIHGAYETIEDALNMVSVPQMKNADIIVAQSDNHKQLLIKSGHNSDNIIVTGTPKIDYALTLCNNYNVVPCEWKDKLTGKKVILLNSSISFLLRIRDWPDFTMDIIKKICSNNAAALIWRPHPLLKATIKSMRPDLMKGYNDIMEYIELCNNAVVDTQNDVTPAIVSSDGLISDYSSIIFQYMATGKPVLCNEKSSKDRDSSIVLFDFYSCYFEKDGVTVDDFLNCVINDQDKMKEQRLISVKKSVSDADGTCGEKTHQLIMNKLLKK